MDCNVQYKLLQLLDSLKVYSFPKGFFSIYSEPSTGKQLQDKDTETKKWGSIICQQRHNFSQQLDYFIMTINHLSDLKFCAFWLCWS